ncbi:hypothetical protein PspLS_06884 [Pyricularia sp. CBS 133598]|nr:hypothetical protein PspLS_06884 [Pyricularia sp. CBS 133598]
MHFQTCIATASAALAIFPCVLAVHPATTSADNPVSEPWKYQDHCELTTCEATWTGGSRSNPCPPWGYNVDSRKVLIESATN